MKSSVMKSVLVLAALNGSQAIQLSEQGIFSKLIAEENEQAAAEREIQEAREYKKQ